jgi:hypothetical protein
MEFDPSNKELDGEQSKAGGLRNPPFIVWASFLARLRELD